VLGLQQENKRLKASLAEKERDWVDPAKFNEVKNEIISMGN